MAYTKLTLKDGETPLNKTTIGHMQDGIYEAHRICVNAVLTANEMNEILANATDENIGVSYMYLGETTTSTVTGKTYKKGAVYTVEKEE